MKLQSLDLAIGMIVVFLLVSTLCTALREAIEGVLKTRAAYLERAIREMLDDKDGRGLAASLFEHPLLSGLFLGNYQPKPAQKKAWVLANGRGLPSYIPASSFAKAVLDIAARGATTGEPANGPIGAVTVESLRARLMDPQSPISAHVRRVVLQALDTAAGDLEQVKKNLEGWFNDSMDRVSGWYKRSTQWLVFVIAIVVTVAGNVDSIAVAKHLYQDEAARQAAVASAQAVVATAKVPNQEKAREVLEQLELPIGWNRTSIPEGCAWFNRVLGWLLTAFAATLGAPFWFDVLNKVMVIRSTVKPHEKSPDESSEDRQARPPPVISAPVAAASPAIANPDAAAAAAAQDELDCCGGAQGELTDDEQLPAASGGVAS
ncbi:MAG: hypothetical protein QM756_09865 [Polyangiaceae bacterium]